MQNRALSAAGLYPRHDERPAPVSQRGQCAAAALLRGRYDRSGGRHRGVTVLHGARMLGPRRAKLVEVDAAAVLIGVEEYSGAADRTGGVWGHPAGGYRDAPPVGKRPALTVGPAACPRNGVLTHPHRPAGAAAPVVPSTAVGGHADDCSSSPCRNSSVAQTSSYRQASTFAAPATSAPGGVQSQLLTPDGLSGVAAVRVPPLRAVLRLGLASLFTGEEVVGFGPL